MSSVNRSEKNAKILLKFNLFGYIECLPTFESKYSKDLRIEKCFVELIITHYSHFTK